MKRILFITNGYSEDLVAEEIIKLLPSNLLWEKISLVDPKLPSGGFSFRNLNYLFKDLRAGLFRKFGSNLQILKKLRRQVDLVVTIGDLIPFLFALVVKAPIVFVGVNKSDYYHWFGFRYTPWEKWLLKKFAQKIYVRDELTKENLNREGIPAEYVGNPLMDCMGQRIRVSEDQKIRETGYQESKNLITIGFLPGTRRDAQLNLEDFEKVIEELVALKDPDTQFRFLVATNLEDVPKYLEKKPFAEVLEEADLIVGLSGTGNEQAAGCGLPVVSFYGRGAQYHKKFAEAQKQLLGEALLLVRESHPKKVALAIWQLVKIPDKMKHMALVGKERMGPGGAVGKIAEDILTV